MLSLNSLALLNTRLLRAYFQFDERVVVLVCLLKYWARKCEIPRMMLNSYTLTLMMIHVLQNCSPPVLPYLQNCYSRRPLKQQKMDIWPLRGSEPFLENDLELMCIFPRDVHFTSAISLQPSLNSSSISETKTSIIFFVLLTVIFVSCSKSFSPFF